MKMFLIILLLFNSSCSNLIIANEESQKLKTISVIIELLKNKDYDAIKEKYGSDYFLSSESYFKLKVDHASELILKYGIPNKKNVSFEYLHIANSNSLTTNAHVNFVCQPITDNIKNASLVFTFFQELGSEKIIDFDVEINSLPNTQLPNLKQ